MITARPTDWQETFTERLMHAAGAASLRLVKKIASRPMASLLVLIMSSGTIAAASNALYGQPVRHPAPFLAQSAAMVTPKVEPKNDSQPIPERLGNGAALSAAPDPLAQATQIAVHRDQVQQTVGVPSDVGNKELAALQARLKQLGFYAHEVDGYYGPKTADAIRAFEKANGLEPKGAASPEIVRAISDSVQARANASSLPVTPAPRPEARYKEALALNVASAPSVEAEILAASAPDINPATDRELILMVQRGLSKLGFLNSEVDGVYDEATARAIREFENYKSYRVTGKMSPELVDLLMETGAFN